MTRKLMVMIAVTAGWLFLSTPSVRALCTVATTDIDGDGNTDLRITGDVQTQSLSVYTLAAGTCITLDCNNDGDFSDAGDVLCTLDPNVTTVTLDLKGKDGIGLYTSGTLTGRRLQHTLLLGPGGNSVVIGQPGSPLTAQGHSSLVYDIVGGTGADAVTLDFANPGNSIANTAFHFRGDLGAGNDTLIVGSPLSNASSTWEVDIGLGTGTNAVTINHSQGGDPLAFSRYRIEGGDVANGTDDVVVNLSDFDSGDDTARLDVAASLKAGNDSFAAVVSPFWTFGYSRIRADGGLGNDTLTVASTEMAATDGLTEIALRGGAGSDVLSLDWFGNFSLSTTGTLRASLDGGDGDDVALAQVVNDPLNTVGLNGNEPSNLDLIVHGGRGSDWVVLLPHDPYENATAEPTGRALLSGGEGDDFCVAAPSFPPGLDQLNCEP